MARSDKVIYAILTMVVISWGLNIVMVKYLTETIPPIIVAAVRMPLAGAALLPFVWRRYGWYKPTGGQWLLLALIGLTSIFLHQLTLAGGVSTTTATNASLILGLNPLTTALLAALFVGEKMNLRLGIGIVLGFLGVLIAVTVRSDGAPVGFSGWGDLIMFVSMLAYVVGALIIKKASGTSMPTLVITAYSTLIGGAMLNLGALATEGVGAYAETHFSGMAWTLILLSALGASSIGTLGWNYGIKLLGANRTAMFINGMPFASMVGGVLFLGERVEWVHLIAFALTAAGIVIGTAHRKPKAAVPKTGAPVGL